MKVSVCLVPVDGGEINQRLEVDLPDIPHAGDYIKIMSDGGTKSVDVLVRRTWWALNEAQGGKRTSLREIGIECEYGHGPFDKSMY